MKAVVITEPGGPEVLQIQERDTPRPGPREVLVDVKAIGVNYFDTAIRQFKVAEIPGMEGSGVVAELGEGVTEFAVGDRVAWLTIEQHGSYTEQMVVPVDLVVPVPDSIDDELAASVLLHGVSADHFSSRSHAVQSGEIAVVHAAAGGVGQVLVQLLKRKGATVIGLVSREEKVQLVKDAGADHVLVSTGGEFVDRVKEITNGEGVHVVFDGAGEPTFQGSLEVIRHHGTLVFYGPLIGTVPSIVMNEIPRSIKVTYGAAPDHIRTTEELRARAAELFSLVESGELRFTIGQRYPLADAAQSHVDIHSRRTVGKLLLIP